MGGCRKSACTRPLDGCARNRRGSFGDSQLGLTRDVHLMRCHPPEADPLFQQYDQPLLPWRKSSNSNLSRHLAARSGLRVLLTRGYADLTEITDTDLERVPSTEKGTDVLDAALCSLGVFDRTPQRGSSRKNRHGRKPIPELVAITGMPEPRSDGTLSGNLCHAYQRRVYVTQSQGNRPGPLLELHRATISRNRLLRRSDAGPGPRLHSVRY